MKNPPLRVDSGLQPARQALSPRQRNAVESDHLRPSDALASRGRTPIGELYGRARKGRMTWQTLKSLAELQRRRLGEPCRARSRWCARCQLHHRRLHIAAHGLRIVPVAERLPSGYEPIPPWATSAYSALAGCGEAHRMDVDLVSRRRRPSRSSVAARRAAAHTRASQRLLEVGNVLQSDDQIEVVMGASLRSQKRVDPQPPSSQTSIPHRSRHVQEADSAIRLHVGLRLPPSPPAFGHGGQRLTAKPPCATPVAPRHSRQTLRMAAPRLFRVILPVRDIEAAASFYAHVLGTPGNRVSGGRHYFDCARDASSRATTPSRTAIPSRWARTPSTSISAPIDLEGTRERAEIAGGRDVTDIEVQPWGERSFYAHDPFENPICFVGRENAFHRQPVTPQAVSVALRLAAWPVPTSCRIRR